MKRIALSIIVVLALVIVGCTDEKNARLVLESQGYTNVQTTGYTFFGCSEDDLVHTGFTAKGQNGSHVKGVVCQGLFFKGATVRIK